MERRSRPDQPGLFDAESPPEPGFASVPGLSLGTCSFQHEAWRGTFYPEGLPAARRLAWYARFHDAVEIDASFYRVPSAKAVERWLATTPADFRFALKAPRTLTHEARLSLEDPAARHDLRLLVEAMPAFGDRKPTILLQLGPGTSARWAERLVRVFDALPPDVPRAVEFRHPSWEKEWLPKLLREGNAARVLVDPFVRETAEAAAAASPGHVYVRLLGDLTTKYDDQGNLRHRYGSILFDRRDDLRFWIAFADDALRRGLRVEIYANNHYEGTSIATCRTIRDALARR